MACTRCIVLLWNRQFSSDVLAPLRQVHQEVKGLSMDNNTVVCLFIKLGSDAYVRGAFYKCFVLSIAIGSLIDSDLPFVVLINELNLLLFGIEDQDELGSHSPTSHIVSPTGSKSTTTKHLFHVLVLKVPIIGATLPRLEGVPLLCKLLHIL